MAGEEETQHYEAVWRMILFQMFMYLFVCFIHSIVFIAFVSLLLFPEFYSNIELMRPDIFLGCLKKFNMNIMYHYYCFLIYQLSHFVFFM